MQIDTIVTTHSTCKSADAIRTATRLELEKILNQVIVNFISFTVSAKFVNAHDVGPIRLNDVK